MYKTFFSFFLMLLCTWMPILLPLAGATESTEPAGQTTLRVAIPTPSSEMNDASSLAYIGYTKEYLHELSQYAGWQYEVVEIPGTYEEGLQNALDMLRAGTADLIAPVALPEEDAPTEGIYYSQSSFLTTTIELQVPNAVYTGEELTEHVRVAVLEGSGSKTLADSFFARNGITPQYISCRNIQEQIDTVLADKADVMINSTLENIPDMSVIAEFSPRPLHFASNDPDLMRELNRANIDMRQANVLFAQELYEEYVIDISQTLTLEETMFIQESEPYVVAVLDRSGPYQYVDEQTGEFHGIGIDLLNFIAEETGLQFEFILADSWEEQLALLQSGQAQISAEVSHNHDLSSDRNMTLTRSYASSPYVLVSHRSFSGPASGRRLALTRESTYASDYYVGDVQVYATVEDCIEAVRSGKADYTYMDLYTARYYLTDSRYSALEFKTQSYTPRSICFGLARPADSALLSILNKSINKLSATDIQNIIGNNVNPSGQTGLFDVIIDYPMQSLLVICSCSLAIASLLVFLLWRKEKTRRVWHKKAMEDGLTGLYNADACRKLVTQKLAEMQPDETGAFLIMDMDNFKEINDGHGHQTGDRVLQEFAALLRQVLRDDSVIARIGGDEFVAFLTSVKHAENIRAICSRVRNGAHLICAGDRPITLSIGAVSAKARDDYDTLYQLADKALYEAKAHNKDQFCLTEREPADG